MLGTGPETRRVVSSRHIASAPFSKGRSRRQLERQMGTMSGWSARALRGLARAEDVLLLAAHSTQPRANWQVSRPKLAMRTNRTFVANCAATLASARSNFGDACQTKKICGSTRRGLAGVALATTYYSPLILTLDLGPSATLPTIRLATRRQSFGRLWPLVARLRSFSRLPKSVWSLGYCRLAFSHL